jgi:hypothetical protein
MASGERSASVKQSSSSSSTDRPKGDWRAVKLLLDILQDIEGRTEPQTEENSFSLAAEKVVAQWMARLHGKE